MLEVSKNVPLDIVVKNQDEKEVSLRDYLGNYVVLYFYPKDSTPGCTKEACDFQNYNDELAKLGVKVIGVSKDSVKSHQKFMKTFSLGFDLWSDNETKLGEAFGTWVEKSMFGKKYMGSSRSTFIIDPEGKVVKVWEKVSVLGHAGEVLEAVKELV